MSACCLSEELVAHADAADRLVREAHLLLDDLHGILAHIWVARTVSEEQTVELHVGIVVVPRHADNLAAAVDEAADDVSLHAAVDEHHLLLGALVVADDLLAAHLVNEINSSILGCRYVLRLVVEENLTHHYAVLAQHLSKLACVDAGDAGHVLTFEPLCKTLYGIPVAVLLAVVSHDDSRSVDFVTLHECRQTVLFYCERRYTIVANQRIGQCHKLSSVRRVGERLWVAHHSSVENYLASHRCFITERLSVELGSVFQY